RGAWCPDAELPRRAHLLRRIELGDVALMLARLAVERALDPRDAVIDRATLEESELGARITPVQRLGLGISLFESGVAARARTNGFVLIPRARGVDPDHDEVLAHACLLDPRALAFSYAKSLPALT